MIYRSGFRYSGYRVEPVATWIVVLVVVAAVLTLVASVATVIAATISQHVGIGRDRAIRFEETSRRNFR